MSRLVVNPDTPQAREIQLKPGANLLGRGFATDFKIEDPSVSSTHCQIEIGDSGATIRDLGSTNGTFLNQAKIQEAALQTGCAIRLGGVEMVFYGDDREPGALVAQVAAPLPVARMASSAAHAVSAPATPAAPARMAPAIRIAAPAAAAPAAAAVPVAAARATDAAVPVTLPSGPARRLAIAGRTSSAHAVTAAPAAAAPAESIDTAIMEPPVAPPMPAAQGGARACKFHPKSFARWVCHKCNRAFCDLCVISRQIAPGEMKKTCRSCGVEVLPLQVRFERPVQKSFFASLPGAAIYPFRGFGAGILIITTIILAGLEFFRFGWVMITSRILFVGFLYLFMQNILHTTASDENEPLGLPSTSEILSGAFQMVVTVLFVFGLPIGLLIARLLDVDLPVSAIIASWLFSCLYFPMAFLAVAMKDTVIAANPLIVLPAMMRAPLHYLTAVVIFVGVFTLRAFGGALIGDIDFTTHEMGTLLLGMVMVAVWKFACVYLLTVSIRVLGLFYNANKERLGWF
jgi:FHA domain